MKKNSNKLKPGFTIVELLVVIVIISVLAAITVIGYVGVSQRAAAATLQTDLKSAATQLEMYKAENDSYPPSGSAAINDLSKSDGTTYIYDVSDDGSSYGLMAIQSSNTSVSYYTSSEIGGTVVAGHLPSYSFARSIGGSGSESIMGSVKTSDDGYVITGWTSSYGAGGSDMFIAKYTAGGGMSWFKTWGGTGSDYGNSIVQDSDGNFVVTGYTTSYGSGNNDMFIAKYTTDGTLSWSKTWGGTYSDIGSAITNTSDGGYAVTGETRSYGTSTTYSDMFIAKYATDGTLSWSKTWGGSASNERGYSIALTADNGFVVAGDARSYGAGLSDIAILKLDSNGNQVWNKTWGGGSDDVAYSVIQTSDGGYATAGITSSYGSGSLDLAFVKYDSSGNLSWDKVMGGSGSDSGKSIVQVSAGSYIIVGSTSSYGAGNSDALTAKFDISGSFVKSKTWGGTNPDGAQSVVSGVDGGYAVFGTTTSYGAINNDALLLKYNIVEDIAGCVSTMCKEWSATVVDPSVSLGSPSVSLMTPSAVTSSPSATTSTPSPSSQVFVSAQQ